MQARRQMLLRKGVVKLNCLKLNCLPVAASSASSLAATAFAVEIADIANLGRTVGEDVATPSENCARD